MSLLPLRLGVNVDHVATIRNARGGMHPDPFEAALAVIGAGADGITIHLREDRRHIRDADTEKICRDCPVPVNLEMAVTDEMLAIALRLKPHAVCLVPERRQEVTTEGGLDVIGQTERLRPFIARLTDGGIRVSLFIDPEAGQLAAAAEVGAPVVELHTGSYAGAEGTAHTHELTRLVEAAALTEKLGLECHAGHGLSFANVGAVAAIAPMRELNIGHFLVGEAMFTGLPGAVRMMTQLMRQARSAA